jgi:hypothetical protein
VALVKPAVQARFAKVAAAAFRVTAVPSDALPLAALAPTSVVPARLAHARALMAEFLAVDLARSAALELLAAAAEFVQPES